MKHHAGSPVRHTCVVDYDYCRRRHRGITALRRTVVAFCLLDAARMLNRHAYRGHCREPPAFQSTHELVLGTPMHSRYVNGEWDFALVAWCTSLFHNHEQLLPAAWTFATPPSLSTNVPSSSFFTDIAHLPPCIHVYQSYHRPGQPSSRH
jgi:hypothetical protein